jgi:hypothetical protein
MRECSLSTCCQPDATRIDSDYSCPEMELFVREIRRSRFNQGRLEAGHWVLGHGAKRMNVNGGERSLLVADLDD